MLCLTSSVVHPDSAGFGICSTRALLNSGCASHSLYMVCASTCLSLTRSVPNPDSEDLGICSTRALLDSGRASLPLHYTICVSSCLCLTRSVLNPDSVTEAPELCLTRGVPHTLSALHSLCFAASLLDMVCA
ncbi:hypothetical protein L798_09345 [Zootermopsis nevadensis]|uniref:Uncharacterized protein n=1 Tax=Zootermopsis nevadensis TaxID=136037 RepID=A0A067RCG6_ZOONE|nr:hypothetical protein L798_09345 [Zootermopsis nevadensis]